MNDLITWSPGITLESIEKQVILKAFKFYRENAAQTAIALGVSDKTVRNKIEQYQKEEKDNELRAIEQREKELEFQRRARGVGIAQPNGYDANVARFEKEKSERLRSETGLSMESSAQASQEYAVPMQEREEVQGVSSQKSRPGRPKRNR